MVSTFHLSYPKVERTLVLLCISTLAWKSLHRHGKELIAVRSAVAKMSQNPKKGRKKNEKESQ